MVPLTALGDSRYTTGPGNIRRFNMFTTSVIRGSAAPGYSSGEAMREMEKIAKERLPKISEWSGAVCPIRKRRRKGRWGW